MKLFQALAILLLISSCAHNRLQFVKVSQKKIVNVEDNTIEEEVTGDFSESSLNPTVTDSRSKDKKFKKNQETVLDQTKPSNRTDFTEPTPTDEEPKISEEEVNDALDAEENARKAKNLSITSVGFLIVGFIPFFLGIGLLVSAVLVILAKVKYNNSRRSRFNTATGQHDEETARKWLLAYWITALVMILILTSLILLLFW